MRPLVFTWPYALAYWVVHFWAFAPEMRITRAAGKRIQSGDSKKDSGSMRVIVAGMAIAMFVAYPLAFVPVLRFPPRWTVPAFWIGIALLIAGSLLRRHCFKTLGEYFTGDVQARADQPVIDRGAYRFVRHPSYTAGILMLTGIGITLGHWISLALLFIVSVAVYSYRIAIEERALVETIGEPYRAFMRTRKRLVPRVW